MPAAVRKDAPEPWRPSADDKRLEHLRIATAKSLAGWLKSNLNLQRPIVSLTGDEMRAMAEHCASAWTVEDSNYRALVEECGDVPDNYDSVLA